MSWLNMLGFGEDKAFNESLEKLNKSIKDMGIWYNGLLNFLLDLEALHNSDVDALFRKYQVVVTKEEKNVET